MKCQQLIPHCKWPQVCGARGECCGAELSNPTTNLAARFWAKVNKASPDECWNWHIETRSARPQFSINGRPQISARVAYELAYGPIPQGMGVLHSCDNGGCCNPKHLRIGTRQDNAADMMLRKRAQCPHTEHYFAHRGARA